MDTPEPFRGDDAVRRIAEQLVPPTQIRGERSRPANDMGTLATLRRFHPVTHGRHCVFETTQVLHAAGVEASAQQQQRWAVVVHCLALARGEHGRRSPGEVLASIDYSESRLRQLLQADATALMDLMPLLARRVAAAKAEMDWWPLAKLLLNAGIDEARADEARSWIARGFIQAASRSGKTAAESTTTTTGSPT